MFSRLLHIILPVVLLAAAARVTAQVSMPDTVCAGTTRLYQVNTPATPSTYTWKVNGVVQGETRNQVSITWTVPGVYVLTVQEHGPGGCDAEPVSGTVYVNAPPAANAGPDAVVCFNTPLQLNGSGGTAYQWSPPLYLSDAGIRNPVVTLPGAGTYRYILSVRSNGCPNMAHDTVFVKMLAPVKVFAGDDIAVALNQTVQLNATDVTGSGFTAYSWSPGFGLNNASIRDPQARFSTSPGSNGITYTVTARTNEGCTATDDITIKVFTKPELYVPTAFTPNGDGLNDEFRIVPAGIKELKYFRVFNRFGELVFTTTNPAIGWNGTYKGKPQDAATFVWMAEGVAFDGTVLFRKGTAVLIR